MPSPIGHALGGIAAGWRVAPARTVHVAAVLALVAAAPDLDLLLGEHREWTHSVGAAVIAGAIALLITRRWRWGLAVMLAWTSHVFLDWLSHDSRPPIGIMAFWPLTHAYYKAGIEIFPAVSRRYWLAEFWFYNLKAAAVEVAVLLPVMVISMYRSRGRSFVRASPRLPSGGAGDTDDTSDRRSRRG
jgi:membrane-bound metal-dependent hydrolase YbcI (DUF457 family)